MVRSIEPWEEAARERTQQFTIRRRKRFLELNSPTQNKIIGLLEHMDKIIEKKSPGKAQLYFFRVVHGEHQGNDGVNWDSVWDQITDSCFSDSDMEGLTLVSRRVGSELIAFRALTELAQE